MLVVNVNSLIYKVNILLKVCNATLNSEIVTLGYNVQPHALV